MFHKNTEESFEMALHNTIVQTGDVSVALCALKALYKKGFFRKFSNENILKKMFIWYVT